MTGNRTDLAVEAAASLQSAADREGVRSHRRVENGIAVTVVEVRTPQAAKALGKPMGRYVTLELGPVHRWEEESYRTACELLAGELKKLLGEGEGTVLVACLGNRAVTPDNLGPLVHDKLLVTRHLLDQMPRHFAAFRSVAAVAPGVLATTGVESGRLIAAAAAEVEPDCIIAVDALAARSATRLCTTVQLSDTGIAPGSGVGNSRQALNAETLGVPVIAVGVPTVVDAATLCGGQGCCEVEGLFVTPRDIDRQVAQCAKVIATAVNLALQPGLTPEEVEALTG